MSVFQGVKEYFGSTFGTVGEKASEEALLSLASLFIHRSQRFPGRMRKHILFNWEKGWIKSTVLQALKDVLTIRPLRSNYLTSVTGAAIRGSAMGNRFYPPEFKTSDIIVILDLASIAWNRDREIVSALLSMLEEGVIRVSLVSLGRMSPEAITDAMLNYDVKFEHGRLVYETDAIVWAAVSSISVINKTLRDQFLDRFSVLSIPRTDLTTQEAFKIISNQRDFEKELELRMNLEGYFADGTRIEKLNRETALKAVRRAVGNNGVELSSLSPRFLNELIKDGLCYQFYGYKDTPNKIAARLRRYLTDYTSEFKSKLNLLEELLKKPRTFDELKLLSGMSERTLYRYLSVLNLVRERKDGKTYYMLKP